MKKMVYSPSILWLVVSCSDLSFSIFVLCTVCTKFTLIPTSFQFFALIGSVISVVIILALIIMIICSIIIFDFWCRPVFLTENELARGFIFRKRIKKKDITGIGIALVYGTKTAESVYNNHKCGVYVCIGQYDESLIKKMGIWETLIRSDLIKILSKCRSLLKKNGTGIASLDEKAYPDTIFFLGEDLDLYAVIKAWMSET
mgnify:CR=1 FL=1